METMPEDRNMMKVLHHYELLTSGASLAVSDPTSDRNSQDERIRLPQWRI
jgi:hypothetical protein